MSDEKERAKIGRLAIRDEGTFVNAYWCPEQHTMEGKIHLASIRKVLVSGDNYFRFEGWRIFVQHTLDPVFEKIVGGGTPVWGEPEPGPEHERSGHG